MILNILTHIPLVKLKKSNFKTYHLFDSNVFNGLGDEIGQI
jgi:hypothetical protein